MIRLAKYQDLPKILEIYEYARQFMRAHGNPTQWGVTLLPRADELWN